MAFLHVVAVVGSVAAGNTDRLVAQVLNAAAEEGAKTTTVHLGHGPLDPTLIDGQIERVAGADAIVLGTPMYRATYAGVLKDFLAFLVSSPCPGLLGYQHDSQISVQRNRVRYTGNQLK